MLPLHLGALHPMEQALTVLLAFGPFLVLGVVIVLRRRAEEREGEEADAAPDPVADSVTTSDAAPDAAPGVAPEVAPEVAPGVADRDD
ncbi:hypothetical protein [Nocardioides marmotae]|uniref:hypothetical protein n=1 Tax=Nocardioides marmotae TaxID=2663857 RepID=UPI0012B51920|nr:hypothetical protein [Nocardioides marmotae]MBC9734159.1 hypothetical protein [Nocardioides marmotae]MTB85262.1 hypothetical protein [Nocardioides marmotae]